MRLPALLAVLAVVALPTAASAKEVTALDVCGVKGCTRLTDRAALRAFEQGGDLAEAAPAGRQRSYLLRVHMRGVPADAPDWTSGWLPSVGLIASHDDQAGTTFTRVVPALERVLHRAAHGLTARPARRYVRRVPVARVAEVVEPPRSPAASDAGAGGSPALAWAGLGALLLLAVGVVRARRRV
jgi:hypothetical protein